MTHFDKNVKEGTVMEGLPENPFESLENTIVFDSRDWASNKRDAWIYGIIVGWVDEEADADAENIFRELSKQHGWSKEEWERLQRLRAEFIRAKLIYNAKN
jgi:hypothetical protein